MRTLILSALALILSGQVSTEVKTKEATVYICTGPKAKKYHATQTCRGLNRCSGSIRQLAVSSARAKGFTPCKICYK